MNKYDLIAILIEVFHLFIIVFFIWGIVVSTNQNAKDKYKFARRIHFVFTALLLPVQILCAGCPLTSIGNQFRLMVHPEEKQSFINGGFIAKICRDWLGFTPPETIIVMVTILLLMIYFGNIIYIKTRAKKESGATYYIAHFFI